MGAGVPEGNSQVSGEVVLDIVLESFFVEIDEADRDPQSEAVAADSFDDRDAVACTDGSFVEVTVVDLVAIVRPVDVAGITAEAIHQVQIRGIRA